MILSPSSTPGYRVTDATGNPVSNAKIKFREVGPGATRTVYSDKELTTPLGHTIRTRSDGYPVVSEGSNTTVLIYTGNTPYHVEITDSNDVAIFPAKDNVRGALDTSPFALAASSSTLIIPVLSKTANYGVQTADKGNLIAANANGGFFTVTLPSAITMGDGWNIGVRNDGTANQVGIAASQNISTSMGDVTSFSQRPGETVWLESNGATYKISGYTPPFISGTVGVILIADRLSTPPVGPTAGARYLVGSPPLDAWSTFAQHDIAEANGQGGWFKVTPPADSGWLAYVQDEDAFYVMVASAWVALAATEAMKAAGGMQLLTSGTVTNAATLDIILTSYSAYRGIVFVLTEFKPVADGAALHMRTSSNGGGAFDAGASDYSYHTQIVGAASTSYNASANASTTSILLMNGVGNAANESCAITIELLGQANNTLSGGVNYRGRRPDSLGALFFDTGAAARLGAGDTDAVRFFFSSGNIDSGKYAVYGLT